MINISKSAVSSNTKTIDFYLFVVVVVVIVIIIQLNENIIESKFTGVFIVVFFSFKYN
jgi:hypothetical protein